MSQHHHHPLGPAGKLTSAEAKEFIDRFAENMFVELLGAPAGTWTKSPYNRLHRLQVEDEQRLLDDGILESHDGWFCCFVLTASDGQEIFVPMRVTRLHHADCPRGSVEFAGVWLKVRDDKKARIAFSLAVIASIQAKYKAGKGPQFTTKFARLSHDLKEILAKVGTAASSGSA